MRALLRVAISLAVIAALGLAVCKALRWDVQSREMTVALVGCALAGIAGTVPIVLSRRSAQAAVAQAALVGSVAHLGVCSIMMAVVFLAHVPMRNGFVAWAFVFYAATLVALVINFTQAIKRAPVVIGQPKTQG